MLVAQLKFVVFNVANTSCYSVRKSFVTVHLVSPKTSVSNRRVTRTRRHDVRFL